MRLQSMLGTKYPIIQAPMAGSDNARMVAAACNAGALGSLGAQYRTPEEIKATIDEIRSLTNRPFAVNLYALGALTAPTHDQIEPARRALQPYYSKFDIAPPSDELVQKQIDPEKQLQVVLDMRVPVFSFTLGVPADSWISAFKRANTTIMGTATNVKEARLLEQCGVDAIIAQGIEAGGHRGTFIGAYENSMIGLMALVPQVVDSVNVPVIAAGGIMDGRGIAAALALGADGVQIGTALLAVRECPVHANYKAAIRNHDADETVITKLFSGGAARGIINRFINENNESSALPFPWHNALTRPIRKVANESGQIDYTNLWSGQAGKLAREMSTEELLKALAKETEDVISRLASSQVED